jgi:hypothetical protein
MTTAVATAEPVTVREAFEQAKVEHSANTERALAADGSDATETATPPDEAKTEPPASDAVTPEISDLISDEEYATLKATHKDNPDALLKELKGVFTKKTQTLAEERKTVAALTKFAPFLQELDRDAASAIKAAAAQLGLTVSDTRVETKAAETATTTAETMADDVIAQFRTALGPELDFLADKLAPAIRSLAENVAKSVVGSTVAPLKTAQESLLNKAAQEQRDTVLKSFGEKHPDWKTHEPKMLDIAAKVKPAEGMEPSEYMDILYTLATKDLATAETTKKVVERMTKAAKADEGKSNPLPTAQVAIVRPANPSVRDAFEAAKRGERWE